MKKFIESGRWHISVASWYATDTLVPSIESAIRNIMLGQNYYRKEFGVAVSYTHLDVYKRQHHH